VTRSSAVDSVSRPMPPPEHMEDAIVLAALTHRTATTPAKRREAWAWLQRLLSEQRQRQAGPFA
jgi:hypothetical protein